MELTGKIIDCAIDFVSGKARLTLEINEKQVLLNGFDNLKNILLSLKLTKYRKKRSLNANSYMWVLISKLEQELSKNDERATKDNIYQSYIKHYGRAIEYQIPTEAVKAMTAVWNAYGLGWFTELVDDGSMPDTKIIRFYYGSSCYSKKRMSRLIKAVVADCEALGIQTMTPQELQTLIDRWDENG